MKEDKWNVYVWNWKSSKSAILVEEAVPFERASFVQDAYLNRDANWDCYIVPTEDDCAFPFSF